MSVPVDLAQLLVRAGIPMDMLTDGQVAACNGRIILPEEATWGKSFQPEVISDAGYSLVLYSAEDPDAMDSDEVKSCMAEIWDCIPKQDRELLLGANVTPYGVFLLSAETKEATAEVAQSMCDGGFPGIRIICIPLGTGKEPTVVGLAGHLLEAKSVLTMKDMNDLHSLLGQCMDVEDFIKAM